MKKGLKQKRLTTGLPVVTQHAAGIDIGDEKHDIAIGQTDGSYLVLECPAYTEDLERLVKRLVQEGVETAAMESTGVYWLNLYLMLEEAGIEPYLVNAKHVKNVTGRKRDDTDAIWLQKLHSCGLLQKSFQPEGDIRTLRTYVRHRKQLITTGSDSVRRMQKALELMNIKLHVVISDILGKTGLLMIEAILNGETDPQALLQYKDGRIKASDEQILKSLKGIWKEEYLFTLQQAYDSYRFCREQLNQCDEKIKALLLERAAVILQGDITGLDIAKKKAPRKNQLGFNAQVMLCHIVGVDLCAIPGISEITTLELIAEIGTDMTKWRSSKHFAAWLNLVPNTKITGGKVISSRMQRKTNHAGQALRMACSSMSKAQNPMGDYSRKMKARVGKKGGVVATAHKLARIIYTMIQQQQPYDPSLLVQSQEKWKLNRISRLEKQLEKLKKAA